VAAADLNALDVALAELRAAGWQVNGYFLDRLPMICGSSATVRHVAVALPSRSRHGTR
jgi:hypothetical protein